MKTLKNVVIIMAIIQLVICGCSNSLSRSKARKIIIESSNYKYLILSDIWTDCISNYDFYDFKTGKKYYGYILPSIPKESYKLIENAGYIKILTKLRDGYLIDFTNKIEPYFLQNNNCNSKKSLIIGEQQEIDITGIKEMDEKVVTVDFIVHYKLSEIGAILSSVSNKNYSVTFQKYDDGWRLRN